MRIFPRLRVKVHLFAFWKWLGLVGEREVGGLNRGVRAVPAS